MSIDVDWCVWRNGRFSTKGMKKLFFSMPTLVHMLLRWSKPTWKGRIGKSYPIHRFHQTSFFRLPLVSGDDSWPGWAALHFLWGMHKMGNSWIKRPRVLRKWSPYAARKMAKACSKQRRTLWVKHTVPIYHNNASNFEKTERINSNMRLENVKKILILTT